MDGTAVLADKLGITSSSIAVNATLGIFTVPAPSTIASVAVDNFVMRRF